MVIPRTSTVRQKTLAYVCSCGVFEYAAASSQIRNREVNFDASCVEREGATFFASLQLFEEFYDGLLQ